LIGIDVIRDGTQIFDSQREFCYDVAPACSGIHSLVAMVLMTVIYGQMFFRSPWKQIGLVAAAFPLAVAGNVFRLMLIIVTAETFGVTAGNFVHENTVLSLLPYVPAVGGLLLLARWWREPEDPAP
jgi:exosortase/archaeosortase family protein